MVLVLAIGREYYRRNLARVVRQRADRGCYGADSQGQRSGHLTPDILQGFSNLDAEMFRTNKMVDSATQDTPVRLYLNEIARFRLLSANEEVELAQAIEAKPL